MEAGAALQLSPGPLPTLVPMGVGAGWGSCIFKGPPGEPTPLREGLGPASVLFWALPPPVGPKVQTHPCILWASVTASVKWEVNGSPSTAGRR